MEDTRMTHPTSIILPCWNRAFWDFDSDMGYRCNSCYAMHGSVGQPRQCQEETEKWKALEAMGGQGWDYVRGGQKKVKECLPSKF
jgi:hypothetical protein